MIDDALLISCPGVDGGLFLAAGTKSVRLSYRPVTGLFVGSDQVYLAYQDDGGRCVRVFKSDLSKEEILSEESMDLHDVLVNDGCVYVALTEKNSVASFDAKWNLLDEWALPGENDSCHLNSVTHYQGLLLASVFGRFHYHRQYKEGTIGMGEVIDIRSGATFISGLSQPHSLTVVDDLLYLCSSEDREVRVYRGKELLKKVSVPGYARGLAVFDKKIYVGLSISRNATISDQADESASIGVIDRASMHFLGAINISSREVYDIRDLRASICLLPQLIDGAIDTGVQYLADELLRYKSGYEAYKSGYEAYKSGYEAYKSGYEAYKSGYEAYKSGYEAYRSIEGSLIWKFAKPIYWFEGELAKLFAFKK